MSAERSAGPSAGFSGRLPELDVLRVVSAISVIAIHTTSRYVTLLAAGYAWNQAMRFAVPMFVAISGFLLMHSEESRESKRDGRPASAASRVARLLPPYVIWTILYTAFYAWLDPRSFVAETGGSADGAVVALAKRLVLGSGAAHLYFVVIIVQMYLAFSILRSALLKRPNLTVGLALAVSLYFQMADYGWAFGLRLLPAWGLPYYGILFPDWIFYFVLGMYARHRLGLLQPGPASLQPGAESGSLQPGPGQLQSRLARNAARFGLLWAVSLVVLLVDGRMTGTFATSLKPSVMLYSVASCAFFYALCLRLAGELRRIQGPLRWFSEQSYGVYLSHILLLNLLDMWGLAPAPHGGIRGIAGMGFLFGEVLLASVAFIYLLSLTPAAGLLGASRRSSPAQPAP